MKPNKKEIAVKDKAEVITGLYHIPPQYQLRITITSVHVHSYSRRYHGKELCQRPCRKGYLRVHLLREDGTDGWISVHRLVAEAVYGPCPEGMQVNHKDGNKLNNHPSNLEYCTMQENMDHSWKLGLRRVRYGKESSNWKGGVSLDRVAYYRQKRSEQKDTTHG